MSYLFDKLRRTKPGASYVSLTVITTFIRFFKGFVLMRYLVLNDLGIISLVTAVMGLYSIFQIGLLNGGYRIYSEEHPDRKKVTNIIYSYFLLVEMVTIFFIIVMLSISYFNIQQAFFAFLASIFGILLVLNNWFRNILISEKKLNEVNYLTLVSTVVSLVFLFTVPHFGLYGALMVTFSIEFIFFIYSIYRNGSLLPTNLNFNLKDYKWVLSFGFLPFLSGIITTYNFQVETWSISSFINTEALGVFYLPKLYIQLFLLIPSAISQLFFPDAVQQYKEKNIKALKRIIFQYFKINLVISVFLILITIFFIRPVILYFVPLHVVGIQYIWPILPGLFVYVALQPIDLIFYASNVLKPLLYSAVLGVIVTTISLLILGFCFEMSLFLVSIIKSLFFFTISLSSLLLLIFNKARIFTPTSTYPIS